MALSSEDNGRHKTLTRRALFLGGAKLALMGALGGRLYYLQVLESERFKTLAEDNRINLRLLAPPRGRIVDRFGVPLAINEPNYRLIAVRERAGDLAALLDALGEIVPLDEEERARILRDSARKRGFVPVKVADNLTWEQVSRIEVNAPDLPGVSIEVGQNRIYPLGPALAQPLGYVASVSEKDLNGDPVLELPGFRIGKSGVERACDTQLRGQAGTSQVEVNAVGRIIRELDREEGRPGLEAVVTLDTGLQTYAHQRLMGERAAAAVVLDVWSGDVLALVSVPSYDPNGFSVGLTRDAWQALVSDPLHPLTNKAIAGAYSPGSTFKMVVALAALEAGVGPAARAYCPGHYRLGNAKFHCWKRGGHGWMDMRQGIKHSCDVFFYDTARKVGIDRISDMARRLGLGQPVGIDLAGEQGGLIPTRDWKLAVLGEPWQGGETLVTAIGQGFVLATPLQLAVMAARIGNGRDAVKPRIVRGYRAPGDPETGTLEPPSFEPLGIPEAHMAIVREAMDMVTNDRRGTAYRSRIEEEGMEMAGKTGTSQVRRITMAERLAGVIKNEQLPWRRRDHALFVAFAPVERPRYACAVVVEHGGSGSKAAAPIARDLMLEVQKRDPLARPTLPLLAAAPRPGDTG